MYFVLGQGTGTISLRTCTSIYPNQPTGVKQQGIRPLVPRHMYIHYIISHVSELRSPPFRGSWPPKGRSGQTRGSNVHYSSLSPINSKEALGKDSSPIHSSLIYQLIPTNLTSHESYAGVLGLVSSDIPSVRCGLTFEAKRKVKISSPVSVCCTLTSASCSSSLNYKLRYIKC